MHLKNQSPIWLLPASQMILPMGRIKSDFFEFMLSYGVPPDDIDVIFDNIESYESGTLNIDIELSSIAEEALWSYHKQKGGGTELEL